jgi:hypothetical protein
VPLVFAPACMLNRTASKVSVDCVRLVILGASPACLAFNLHICPSCPRKIWAPYKCLNLTRTGRTHVPEELVDAGDASNIIAGFFKIFFKYWKNTWVCADMVTLLTNRPDQHTNATSALFYKRFKMKLTLCPTSYCNLKRLNIKKIELSGQTV